MRGLGTSVYTRRKACIAEVTNPAGIKEDRDLVRVVGVHRGRWELEERVLRGCIVSTLYSRCLVHELKPSKLWDKLWGIRRTLLWGYRGCGGLQGERMR